MTNKCFSGGAKGADVLFGEMALKVGHEVIHFKSKDVLDPLIATEADKALVRANQYLNRTYPTDKEYVNNLLRRNYLQIKDTNRIYAVTPLNEHFIPYGGTAWAIAMGIDRVVEEIYVFDYNKNKWFEFNYVKWQECNDVPYPQGLYTGIGSRELPENGKQAIINLYSNTKT